MFDSDSSIVLVFLHFLDIPQPVCVEKGIKALK